MSASLLICSDLDRTLIPNGPQSESAAARAHFRKLAARPEVTLAYASGRDRQRIERAISHYQLPQPDYVIGDVGTSIYRVDRPGSWIKQQAWSDRIGADWGDNSHAQLKRQLAGVQALRPQEHDKQNQHKLSYYVPLHCDLQPLSAQIEQLLQAIGANCNLIWSTDEPNGVGLLDIVPRSASKLTAIEALMEWHGFNDQNTVFCGDSGNDMEVLVSHLPAVLVANAEPMVSKQAIEGAGKAGFRHQLYLASGGFHGMNGNYSAGMLEGIAYFHPESLAWMGLASGEQ